MDGTAVARTVEEVTAALAVLTVIMMLVAVSQIVARVAWRAQARPHRRRPRRWKGHVDATQAEALWGSAPPRALGWLWRGLYPATLRARPDGLLLTPRGPVFARAAGRPHTVIRWSDLRRARVRAVPRLGPERGLSAVRLTRVSLLLAGATARRVGADPVTGTAHLRFVTPAPEGLGGLVNREPQRPGR